MPFKSKNFGLVNLFEAYRVFRNKLKDELSLFMAGQQATKSYIACGVTWCDYKLNLNV